MNTFGTSPGGDESRGVGGGTRSTTALPAQLRTERSAPLSAAIRAWAHQPRALPESGLGKAIAYMLGLWPGLTRFLDDPRIPLDTNATERALRGTVIGRKNHYGSRSRRGTEVAALTTPGTVTLPHTLAT
jgi:transposase IS66 family protein